VKKKIIDEFGVMRRAQETLAFLWQ